MAEGQQFEGNFDFGSAILDSGTHEITLQFVSGDPRIRFGLVLFKEAG